MSSVKNHNIVIIEPSQIVQQGIKALLSGSGTRLEVKAYFFDYAVFQDSWQGPAPDAIVVNPSALQGRKPIAAKKHFLDYPHTAIIAIVYGHYHQEYLQHFDAVIDIDDDGAHVIKIIKAALLTGSLPPASGKKSDQSIFLSDREREILVSVAQGMANKEIADKHHISVHTVISHRKNISRKTGIKTVSGLTIYAIFNNLISQDELQ